MPKIVPQVRLSDGGGTPAQINNTLELLDLQKSSRKIRTCLIVRNAFAKFRGGRLAAPRFSSLSGCLDV
jgi:hypothetical protein